MKKILALTLTLVMIMAMSVNAFAAAGEVMIDSLTEDEFVDDNLKNELPFSQDIEVTVRLDSDGDGIPDEDDTVAEDELLIYLSWEDMSFMYSKRWNATSGEYDVSWESDPDNFISVSNHSTVDVKATFSYEQINEDYDIEFSVRQQPGDDDSMIDQISGATFENNVLTLSDPTVAGNIVIDEYGTKFPYADIAVNLAEGAPAPTVDSSEAVGTITVTLEAGEGYVAPQEPVPEEPEVYELGYTEEELATLGSVPVAVDQPISLSITETGTETELTIMSAYCDSEYFEWDSMEGTFVFTEGGNYEVTFSTDSMDEYTVNFLVE